MSTRIVFNSEGFKKILTSEGCHDLVQLNAETIADKANANNDRGGEGFKVSTQIGGYGGGRWIGFVSTTDKNSKIAESEDKALTRALS